SGDNEHILPLPIAGLMATGDYSEVADQYATLNTLARSLGSPLSAPFMTLSFLSLIVIPKLKLSDRGLFDVEKFEYRELFEG
ncbi:MAG: adenine deaminase, partial [Nitrospirales bacterium]|nr:adenine deaminase [Nitrospirales bacterium]